MLGLVREYQNQLQADQAASDTLLQQHRAYSDLRWSMLSVSLVVSAYPAEAQALSDC